METTYYKECFVIYFGAVLLIAALSWLLVGGEKRSAHFKRNYLRIGMAIYAITFVLFGYFSNAPHFSFWSAPFVLLIYFLNLSSIRYCDVCGTRRTIKNLNFPEHILCQKCGAEVKTSGWF